MTSDEKVSLFAGTSVTALKNGAKPDESKMSSLAKDALTYSTAVTGIAPAVQDSLSEAAREPIFKGMAGLVKGEKKIDKAVQEVLDKNAE